MDAMSPSGNFNGMTGICPDRRLKQRSALRKQYFSFDLPPPCGGLGNLSAKVDCGPTKS
jgi:hypothetical protein